MVEPSNEAQNESIHNHATLLSDIRSLFAENFSQIGQRLENLEKEIKDANSANSVSFTPYQAYSITTVKDDKQMCMFQKFADFEMLREERQNNLLCQHEHSFVTEYDSVNCAESACPSSYPYICMLHLQKSFAGCKSLTLSNSKHTGKVVNFPLLCTLKTSHRI